VALVRKIDVTESHVINASTTHSARREKLSNLHILKDGGHIGKINICTQKLNTRAL
jgi:hypothetical protein